MSLTRPELSSVKLYTKLCFHGELSSIKPESASAHPATSALLSLKLCELTETIYLHTFRNRYSACFRLVAPLQLAPTVARRTFPGNTLRPGHITNPSLSRYDREVPTNHDVGSNFGRRFMGATKVHQMGERGRNCFLRFPAVFCSLKILFSAAPNHLPCRSRTKSAKIFKNLRQGAVSPF